MKTIKLLTVLTVLGLTTACVATWGEAHNIKEANADSITIQYDSALASHGRTVALAEEHCAGYGKDAEFVADGMPGLLLGIIETKFNCV